MKIIENANLVELYKMPKTKKKRIVRKWAKNRNNWRPSREAIFGEGYVICHPSLAIQIRALTKDSKDAMFGQ